MAPSGLLWDDDDDASTDALVMAWLNEDGKWEALRDINAAGDPISILSTPSLFDTIAEVERFLGLTAGILEFEEHIEDLANLNLNFGIELATAFTGWFDSADLLTNTFTLRLTSIAAPVSVVPLPASVAFLLLGVGALGATRRFRKAAAA